jgi:protein-S-isoprenylcysteine O-methyltransferase Ste14
MNLIFIVSYCIWFVSEILLNRLMRSRSNDRKNADQNSLLVIWLTVILSVAIAVYLSFNYSIPISNHSFFQYLGIVIILIGIFLRLLVIRSLGKFFTVDVTIRQDHKLKKDGFYKYLRHPSYFASLISFIGFGFSLNNWLSLIIILASVLVVFVRRIKVEENVLIEQFGKEYSDYMKSTKGLIPFFY